MNIVTFKANTIGIVRTIKGHSIGKNLAVAMLDGQIGLFNLHTGKKVIDGSFNSVPAAKYLAELLDRSFGEYFVLSELGDVDIFALAKWSVPEGLKLYELLQLLDDKRMIEISDIEQAYLDAQREAKKWIKL